MYDEKSEEMYKYLGDTTIRMYDILNYFSCFILFITNISYLKSKSDFLSNISLRAISKLQIKPRYRSISNPKFFAFLEIVFISLIQYAFTPTLNSNLAKIVNTGDNYFGLMYFSPIILLAFFYIIKIAPLKQLDMITPAYASSFVIVKIACFCAGCCNGFEWEKGLYNAVDERYEFPVQLVEAALSLFIFIFLLWYRKKAKEGTMFPVYLILYSGTRFFSEFLRHEEEVFWIFKTYHLLCIGGVILGLVELLLVQKYKDKINDFYKPKRKARIKF